MMAVLSKNGIYSKILYKQWEAVIGYTSYGASNEYIEKYRKIIEVINVERRTEIRSNYRLFSVGFSSIATL